MTTTFAAPSGKPHRREELIAIRPRLGSDASLPALLLVLVGIMVFSAPRVQAGLLLDSTVTSGTERVLVLLVEFAGTDQFLWTPGVSTWDPIGQCDPAEYNYAVGTPEATQKIIQMYSLDQPTSFTYTGPLHNRIARPLSAEDPSGTMIWTSNFSPSYYRDILFGNGQMFLYLRQDRSAVTQDFVGKSLKDYYLDLSNGRYTIDGDVIGWISLPHSVWWYGADPAPGSRSGVTTPRDGGIPGAGTSRTLVRDALDALNAISNTIPGFDWRNYDRNGDGIVDHLWIIHAGLGEEEDSTALLNRTDYGEGGIYSSSSVLYPAYTVATYPDTTTVAVGPFTLLPENCGISLPAHELANHLGAGDLNAYGTGSPSAGFWTLMADFMTGYPLGFEPPAPDPLTLDTWGWLDPLVVTDPARIYTVRLGQASRFPGGDTLYRGVRIVLPDQLDPLPVTPAGSYYWWGGRQDVANARMTLNQTISIPPAGATLSFDAAWDIETEWDFLWVQASADSGLTWTTLINPETSSTHDPGWIGSLYGFPDDLAAAGIGGFTGTSVAYPAFQQEQFDLAAFAGQSVLLRFWYMTDWGTLYAGPFIDNIRVISGVEILLADTAEADSSTWTYEAPWVRSAGYQLFPHSYYLQWRNVSTTGGYDECLGNPLWRFGPANTGLLVWYRNGKYEDNEVFNHLPDWPGFGPKGKMLLVDSHPEPYRDPYWVDYGYANEGANVTSRSQMRDAPFSLRDTVDFTMPEGYVVTTSTLFQGRPAVSEFSDALGYYPGSEFVSRGPGYNPPSYKWVTKQWDSSVVIPSTKLYGIRAPGYTANEEFRWAAQRAAGGRLVAYWFGSATGLGYDGGTGNPGDVGGEYGWHVQVLNQTDQAATVRIWNSHEASAFCTLWYLY